MCCAWDVKAVAATESNVKYDNPHGEYLGLALKILDKGADVNFTTLIKQGEPLTKEETAKYIEEYIKKLEVVEFLNY